MRTGVQSHVQYLLVLIIALGAASPAFGQAGPPMMPAAQSVVITEEDLVDPRPADTVIAITDWGDITIEDVEAWISTDQVQWLRLGSVDQIPALPDEHLRTIASEMATRITAEREFDSLQNFDKRGRLLSQFDGITSRMIVGEFVTTYIDGKITPPTDEEINDYYEKNSIEFDQKFAFRMRHLILLTYEPYVVSDEDVEVANEGDQPVEAALMAGLKAIAERVSGDPAKYEGVRLDAAGKPARYDEETADLKPLTPGEKLLVPMSEERAEQVHERLELILTEMGGEVGFEELIEKYSQTEENVRGQTTPWLPAGSRPIIPSLLEQGEKTPVDGISDIFRTKHGWQVMEVVDKKEEGIRPLDEVRNQIIGRLNRENREKLIADALEDLFQNENLEINYDVLTSGDLPSSNTVVATIGDDELIFLDIQRQWTALEQPVSRDDAYEMLKTQAGKLQIALVREKMSPVVDDASTTLGQRLQLMRTGFVGAGYMRALAMDQAEEHVTDEKLRDFYEQNKEARFRLSERVRYTSMERRLTPRQQKLSPEEQDPFLQELIGLLNVDVSTLKTAGDFEQKAEEVNANILPGDPRIPSINHLINITNLPDEIRENLSKLEVGQWSEPFTWQGFRVLSVLLQEHAPSEIQSYEDVEQRVIGGYKNELMVGVMKVIEEEFLNKSGLEILLETESDQDS